MTIFDYAIFSYIKQENILFLQRLFNKMQKYIAYERLHDIMRMWIFISNI